MPLLSYYPCLKKKCFYVKNITSTGSFGVKQGKTERRTKSENGQVDQCMDGGKDGGGH